MITDPRPRGTRLQEEYDASDRQVTIPLPPAVFLQEAAQRFQGALLTGEAEPVAAAGEEILALLASFYGVNTPALLVLGARPQEVLPGEYAFELFGDYTLATRRIRIWMRTAVREKVTSFRGLLNTLLHEFCHHLDVERLGYPDTPHTRGFYGRVDELYHLALGTPPDRRKPLAWIKSGAAWRIDWRKLRMPR